MSTEEMQSLLQDVEKGGGFAAEGFQEFSKSASTILLASFLVLLYLLIGVIGFTILTPQQLTMIDSLYLVVSLTTVGYDDSIPNDNAEQIFAMVFQLVGIFVLGGLVLGILFDHVVELFESWKEDATRVYNFMDATMQRKMNDDDDSGDEEYYDRHHHRRDAFGQELWNNLHLLVWILAASSFLGYLEGWSLLTSFYYAFVTATTGELLGRE